MGATAEQQQEALERATTGNSEKNDFIVQEGFAERGIYDAEPRVNCFSYGAWQALGRQVTKGQHGIRIQTWRPGTDKATGKQKLYPKIVSVFHISQTIEK